MTVSVTGIGGAAGRRVAAGLPDHRAGLRVTYLVQTGGSPCGSR